MSYVALHKALGNTKNGSLEAMKMPWVIHIAFLSSSRFLVVEAADF